MAISLLSPHANSKHIGGGHLQTFLRICILIAAAFSIGGSAFAFEEAPLGKLSPQERRAFSEAKSVRFILATLSRCDRIRNQAEAFNFSAADIRLDAKSRVSTLRYGTSDIVVEYDTDASKHPSAIIALGVRIPMKPASAFNAESLGALKARAIMYRKVRELCGLPSLASSNNYFFIQTYIDEGHIYTIPDYYDVGFWNSYWEPAYFYGSVNFAPNPQCLQGCQEQCDWINDLNQIGCASLGGLVATANPGGGILVGAACALGSLGGKYVCRTVDCPRKCN